MHSLGFRIVSLQTFEHKILGSNIFEFTSKSDKDNALYISVIIGPNGTGKSEILRFILLSLRAAYFKIKRDEEISVPEKFELTYLNGGEIFTVSNVSKIRLKPSEHEGGLISKIKFTRNGNNAEPNECSQSIPLSIVANSFLLIDKFIVPRNNNFSNYTYLGVRNRPQQASTRSFVRKVVELTVEGIEGLNFEKGLQGLANLLGQSTDINVRYNTRSTKKFFNGNLSVKFLSDYFNELEAEYLEREKKPPFSLSAFKRISKDHDRLIKAIDFANVLASTDRFDPRGYRKVTRALTYKITNYEELKLLREEFDSLNVLFDLQLLTAPNILLGKNAEYGLEDSSSGEFHLLSTFMGLMATVKPYSIVLIDEPEISLHPNWQMQFIQLLRSTFKDDAYNTCHFIIATHSHFLISDLPGEISQITALNKKEGKVEVLPLKSNINTYGWSAEEILLEVFRAPTTRNRFVSDLIADILEEIANKDLENRRSRLKEKVNNLKDLNLLNLSASDPLKEIVVKILEKYG